MNLQCLWLTANAHACSLTGLGLRIGCADSCVIESGRSANADAFWLCSRLVSPRQTKDSMEDNRSSMVRKGLIAGGYSITYYFLCKLQRTSRRVTLSAKHLQLSHQPVRCPPSVHPGQPVLVVSDSNPSDFEHQSLYSSVPTVLSRN